MTRILMIATSFLFLSVARGEIISANLNAGSNDGQNTPVNWNGSFCSKQGNNGVIGGIYNIQGVHLEPQQGDAFYTDGHCAYFNFNTFNGVDGIKFQLNQNALYVLDVYVSSGYQKMHIVKELYTILGQFAFMETLLGPSSVNRSIDKVFINGGLSQ